MTMLLGIAGHPRNLQALCQSRRHGRAHDGVDIDGALLPARHLDESPFGGLAFVEGIGVQVPVNMVQVGTESMAMTQPPYHHHEGCVDRMYGR